MPRYRNRAVMIGSEEDMKLLEREFLTNIDRLEEDEGMPELQLEALSRQVREVCAWEAGDRCTFLYDMIAARPFGCDEPGTGRHDLRRIGSGMWAASFIWDSPDDFQAEDWVRLSNRCGRMPVFALHACENFALDKGGLYISNGRVTMDWDLMAETWLWLIDIYECGLVPEDAAARLRRLEKAMRDEEWDQSVEELLASCIEQVRTAAALAAVPPEAWEEALRQGNYAAAFRVQKQISDGILWETDHQARWIACLRADMDAWHAGR